MTPATVRPLCGTCLGLHFQSEPHAAPSTGGEPDGWRNQAEEAARYEAAPSSTPLEQDIRKHAHRTEPGDDSNEGRAMEAAASSTRRSLLADELEALGSKATEAPWAWDQRGEKVNEWGLGVAMDRLENPIAGRFADEDVDYVEYVCSHEAATCNYKDPALICALRNNLPAIVAALRSAPSATRLTDPVGAYALPSTEEVERTLKDAARYRWLVENDLHNELFSYGGDKQEIDDQVDKCIEIVSRADGRAGKIQA